jgi:GNAT superfamily N-acetyltransferase
MTTLKMIHTALAEVPEPEVPPGYALRRLLPCDREELVRLFRLGDLGIENLEQLASKFEFHESYRPEHVLVVESGNELAGTASAFIDREDHSQGFLHMVSVDPKHRGRKLGRTLVYGALRLHADLGLTQQWLLTEESRLVAIQLYLSVGYVPSIGSDDDRQRWDDVTRRIAESKSNRRTGQ